MMIRILSINKIVFFIIIISSCLFGDSNIPISIYHEGEDKLGKHFLKNIKKSINLSNNLYEIDQNNEKPNNSDIILILYLKTSDLCESNISHNSGEYSQYKIDFLLIGDYYLPYQLHNYGGIISNNNKSYSIEYEKFLSEFTIAINNYKNWKRIDDDERSERIRLFFYILFGIGIFILIRFILKSFL